MPGGWSKEYYERRDRSIREEEARRADERRAQQERMYRRIDEDRRARQLANPHSKLNRARRLEAEQEQSLMEAEYNQRTQLELAKLQEKARLDVQQWEYKYTPKQKQRIANNNQRKQDVMQSPDFTQEQKMAAAAEIDRDTMSILPGMMPKEGPTYNDGQGIGDVWVDVHGNTVTREENGIPRTIQTYDKSREYFEAKAKAEREKMLWDLQIKLATEQVPQYTTDENGVPQQSGMRNRTPEEVSAVMNVLREDTRRRETQQNIEANTLSPIEGELVVPPEIAAQREQQATHPIQRQDSVSPEVTASGVQEIKEPEYVQNARRWVEGNEKFTPGAAGYKSGQMSKRKSQEIISEWENELKNLPENIPHVSSDADYDRLAEGTTFIDPEGHLRVK